MFMCAPRHRFVPRGAIRWSKTVCLLRHVCRDDGPIRPSPKAGHFIIIAGGRSRNGIGSTVTRYTEPNCCMLELPTLPFTRAVVAAGMRPCGAILIARQKRRTFLTILENEEGPAATFA